MCIRDRKWRGIRLWHIGVAVVFASALMAVSTMFADEDVTEYYAVIISICLLYTSIWNTTDNQHPHQRFIRLLPFKKYNAQDCQHIK